MSFRSSFSRLSSYFNSFSSISSVISSNNYVNRSYAVTLFSTIGAPNRKNFHTSFGRLDLMEFFDDQKNWGATEVKVGRAWKVEELRIKSNSDLHKLWYVLLKERNMLLTMQHEYNENFEPFPNPERIDKVEISMENLETVVRERNVAYYQLETGETGERPSNVKTNCFGLEFKYKMREHLVPKEMNKKFLSMDKLCNQTNDHGYIKRFLERLKERQINKQLFLKRRRYQTVCGLLERFPNLDEEALRHQFPDIDIEKAKKDKLSRGHRENAF